MSWESKYFTSEEMACKCGCGQEKMNPEFMARLTDLREFFGKPMAVTSGYRCPEHPIEARKSKLGAHTYGQAVDIAVQGTAGYEFVKAVMEHGEIKRVGVQQKGKNRFVHLDSMTDGLGFPSPWVYSY